MVDVDVFLELAVRVIDLDVAFDAHNTFIFLCYSYDTGSVGVSRC
jgi:hypothetical protein